MFGVISISRINALLKNLSGIPAKWWQENFSLCYCFIYIFIIFFATGNVLAETPELIALEEYSDFLSSGQDPLILDSESTPTSGFNRLLKADAITARGNDIFVADTSQRTIFHIDRSQRLLSKFASLQGGIASDIFVASDFSVYVIDQFLGQVIQYSRDGRKTGAFGNQSNLTSPVAITESEDSHRLLVADKVTNQVLVFNRLGGLSRIIGQNINIPNPAGSILDIASEKGFIYLLDELTREVSVTDTDGRKLYSVGNAQLKNPVAIALDQCRRLYVADQFDSSIHVFMGEDPLVVFENRIFGPGMEMISDISIDNGLLYISDGITGYIKVMKIEGECS